MELELIEVSYKKPPQKSRWERPWQSYWENIRAKGDRIFVEQIGPAQYTARMYKSRTALKKRSNIE